MTEREVIDIITEEISKETGTPVRDIDVAASFYSLGLDSISSVFVMDEVQRRIEVELNPMYFWDHPTIELLARHITTIKK